MSAMFIFKKENKCLLLFTQHDIPPHEAINIISECLETKRVGHLNEKREIHTLSDIWDRVRCYSYFGRWGEKFEMLQNGREDYGKWGEIYSYPERHLYGGIEDQMDKIRPSEIILSWKYEFCYIIDMNYKKITFYGDGEKRLVKEMKETADLSYTKKRPWDSDRNSWKISHAHEYLARFCKWYYYTPDPHLMLLFLEEHDRLEEESKREALEYKRKEEAKLRKKEERQKNKKREVFNCSKCGNVKLTKEAKCLYCENIEKLLLQQAVEHLNEVRRKQDIGNFRENFIFNVNTPITEIRLEEEITGPLLVNNIKTVGDLVIKTEKDLLPLFKKNTVIRIKDLLSKQDLGLGMKESYVHKLRAL